jgi:hypothetical protein
MPYYLDAGAGNSTLTWQSVLGVGHAFKWGEVILAYRYLSYEQSSNKLIEDLSFGGFALGVNFRFGTRGPLEARVSAIDLRSPAWSD